MTGSGLLIVFGVTLMCVCFTLLCHQYRRLQVENADLHKQLRERIS